MENVRKWRDIKLLTTGKRSNYLVLELDYHAINFFTKKLLDIEIKKLKYT